MGIDIPPPKGGPATFPKVSNAELQSPLTPEGDKPKSVEPALDSEQNDALSLCLSEGRRQFLFKCVPVITSLSVESFYSFVVGAWFGI